MLASVVGFITFLLLLPAREEQLVVDRVGRRSETVHHCYTHLGWQDVLGPLSCSRLAAAAAGAAVALLVVGVTRWREGRAQRQSSAM